MVTMSPAQARTMSGSRLPSGRKHAMPPSQRVTLEPPVAVVLRQHLHHAAVVRDLHVAGLNALHKRTIRHLEHRTQSTAVGLIGTEQPEPVRIAAVDLGQHGAELSCRLGALGAG